MLRVAERVYLHKPDEVADKLKEAAKIVAEADLETGMRAKALELVFGRLTEQQVLVENISPAGVVLDGHRPQG